MAEPEVKKDDVDPRAAMNYPLLKFTDMKEEMRMEAIEAISSAVEKYPKKWDIAARTVKETMDKKYSPNWQVIIGEGFGFEVVSEKFCLIYMYLGGSVAVLCYKT